jgi:hypothetical protein
MEGRMVTEKMKEEVKLNDENKGRGEGKIQKEKREKHE